MCSDMNIMLLNVKKAALTNICFPKVHLQKEKKKKRKFPLISIFWALPDWSGKGMNPKLRKRLVGKLPPL